MNTPHSTDIKLFLVLLGSKAPGRNVEQHDYFFGIGASLKELVPVMNAFWPEAGASLHLDGWREVNYVDGYRVQVVLKQQAGIAPAKKLFFINLGGYQANKLEEQHYTVLTVADDRTQAVQGAKKTVFFKTNTMKGAGSHIDEKYGIDVDDVYRIEDILANEWKERYGILITPAVDVNEDQVNLGYFKLDKIK